MSDRSFLALEKAFQLPNGTLPLFDTNGGEHSCQLKFSATNSVESVGKNGNIIISLDAVVDTDL
jgi:hypothetical protein